MNKSEKIWIASIVVYKRMNFEELYYSDYMYASESETDSVWIYVEECGEIGQLAFYEKYKDYKLY